MTDAQVIETWQQFRKAAAFVDSSLAAVLDAADSRTALMHEALNELAAVSTRMLAMTDLAGRLGVTSGGLTKLVDRLVDARLVRRQHSATDRRVIYAVLTNLGHQQQQQGTADYSNALRVELGALGSQRLAALRQISAMINRDHERRVEANRDAVKTAAHRHVTDARTNRAVNRYPTVRDHG